MPELGPERENDPFIQDPTNRAAILFLVDYLVKLPEPMSAEEEGQRELKARQLLFEHGYYDETKERSSIRTLFAYNRAARLAFEINVIRDTVTP